VTAEHQRGAWAAAAALVPPQLPLRASRQLLRGLRWATEPAVTAVRVGFPDDQLDASLYMIRLPASGCVRAPASMQCGTHEQQYRERFTSAALSCRHMAPARVSSALLGLTMNA
jgi:hypothetical protein